MPSTDTLTNNINIRGHTQTHAGKRVKKRQSGGFDRRDGWGWRRRCGRRERETERDRERDREREREGERERGREGAPF